jgi:hypothetical protein
MEILRQTAVASYVVVPLIDTANRPSYKASPTLAAGDVKIIRHTGAAWNVANIGTLPAIVDAGATKQILITLTATELTSDNLDYPIIVQFIDQTATKEWDDQEIVIWTKAVPTNVIQVLGTAITCATAGIPDVNTKNAGNIAWGSGAITAASIATDAIGADEIAAGAVTKIQTGLATPTNITAGTITTATNVTNDVGITQTAADKVWSSAARTLTSFGTLVADIWVYGTRTITSFGTIVADVATAVWSAVTRSLTDKAGFSISGTKQTLDALNDVSAATVNSEVDTALADIDLDHLSKTGSAPTPTIGSNLDKVMNKDGSQTFSQSTDALEAIADNASGGLTEQEVRNAMSLAPTVGDPVSGSIDYKIDDIKSQTDMMNFTGDNIDANVEAIDTNAGAVAKLAASVDTESLCTVDTSRPFAPTTTEFETGSTVLAKDRWVIFRSGTLIGQAKPITACEPISGKSHITTEAFTAAPSNGDTFVIV